MPVNDETRDSALEALKGLRRATVSDCAASRELGINSAHVWRALHEDYVSPRLVNALAAKGLIPKPEPVDPRPRVWMRTDDVNLAVEQLFRHYKRTEIVEALARKLKIASIEWYSELGPGDGYTD